MSNLSQVIVRPIKVPDFATRNGNLDKMMTAITTRLNETSSFTYTAVATTPTANNDTVDTAALGATFKAGDMWVNNKATSEDDIYICKDATATSAVWELLLESSTNVKSYDSATAAPTADNDNVDTAVLGVAFNAGDIWIKINTNDIYVCKDATATAAVWERMLVERETSFLHTSNVVPTVNNDGVDTATLGVIFKVGDMWIDSVTKRMYVCNDIATGAAIWDATAKNTVKAAAAPAVTDDLDLGFLPGDTWVNQTGPAFYVCISNADGAADWDEITIT